MRKAIVVGSGAGGATVARELQGKYEVTVMESGGLFRPFSINLGILEKSRVSGLFFDERVIQLLFPNMRVRKTKERMVLVNGRGLGGTTAICAGNAVRMDAGLKKIGINLDDEFSEIYREIPITSDHHHLWKKTTKRLFEICGEMQLDPKPLPKMGNYRSCVNCGRCVLGCPNKVKWDSRKFLDDAVRKGTRVICGSKVVKIAISNDKAEGVLARRGWKTRFYPADLVILAAGGFDTPVILENSGIQCENRLFVDPVLCVATQWKDSFQNNELSMPFIVQKEHYIISPYFDYLSFFFNKDWGYPAKDILGLMIKLADSNQGKVSLSKIDKVLTADDRVRLDDGVEICKNILSRFGVKKDRIFLGTINAGHPGGTLPLTEEEAVTFHNPRLPENLYVADASLIPYSLGNPPILTIIAIAKRIGKICVKKNN